MQHSGKALSLHNAPDWKNNTDQTCSCPRGWRLSARWGFIESLLKPLGLLQHSIVLLGLMAY